MNNLRYSVSFKGVFIITVLLLLCPSCSKDNQQRINIKLSVYPEYSGEVTGSGEVEKGSVVVLLAKAKSGYVFSHWQDAFTEKKISTNTNYTLTATKNIELIAVFEESSLVSLIDPTEQQEIQIIPNYGTNVPKDVLFLMTRYIGDEFIVNGISRENSGVINNQGNVHMILNTKDLERRDLYTNITGGGPHIWLSKLFIEAFPWSKEGQYLRLEVEASVPYVHLEDKYGNQSNTNFSSDRAPVTQLSFGFYIHDTKSGNRFAHIVCMYESRGVYKERANAHDTFNSYFSSPIAKSSKFITVPKLSALLQSIPFEEKKTFEVHIKRENLEKIIQASKAPLSSDLAKYELVRAGVLFELPNYVLNGHNSSEVKLSNFRVSIQSY